MTFLQNDNQFFCFYLNFNKILIWSDWRKCTKEVKEFQECINKSKNK